MFTLSDFRLSPERQQAIDDCLNFPVWAMLTQPGVWTAEGVTTRVTREFCRSVGMTPREILSAQKRGAIELVPNKN